MNKTKIKEIPKLKLDLGCGQNPKEGFEGVDLYKGAKHVVDLFKFPWPFKSESVEEIYTNQFFEHIPASVRFPFMDECWRILMPEGKMTVIAPYYTSMRSIQDPTHQWPPLSEASFLYFNKGWREQNKLTHYDVHCDFDFSYAYNMHPDIAPRSQEFKMFAVAHYVNVITDVIINLVKRP